MKEALIETTTYRFVPVGTDSQEWVAKGEVVRFQGFMKLYVEGTDEEEGEDSKSLPFVSEGETLRSKGIS